MLNITDNLRSFMVNTEESLDLELKLNVTQYGHQWKSIGDILYDHAIQKIMDYNLIVTFEQYTFLEMLLTKTRKECESL